MNVIVFQNRSPNNIPSNIIRFIVLIVYCLKLLQLKTILWDLCTEVPYFFTKNLGHLLFRETATFDNSYS